MVWGSSILSPRPSFFQPRRRCSLRMLKNNKKMTFGTFQSLVAARKERASSSLITHRKFSTDKYPALAM